MGKLAVESLFKSFEEKIEAYSSKNTRAEAFYSLINTHHFNLSSLNDTKTFVNELNLIEELDLSRKILHQFLSRNTFNLIQLTKTKTAERDKELFNKLSDLLEDIVSRKENEGSAFLDEKYEKYLHPNTKTRF